MGDEEGDWEIAGEAESYSHSELGLQRLQKQPKTGNEAKQKKGGIFSVNLVGFGRVRRVGFGRGAAA